MRILCTSDWHVRASSPQYRIDNYYESQKAKVLWIMDLAFKEECNLILHGGDFFDSHTTTNKVLADYVGMLLLNKPSTSVHVVWGQHDMRFRTKENTALGILVACEAVTVEDTLYPGVAIWHNNWEEPILQPSGKENVNILITHRMITKGGPLWPGQTDYFNAKDFLIKNPEFQLIISGDNHQQFAECYKGRWLINTGSLMRSTIGQVDHHPSVSIYDTETKKMEQHFIPVKLIEEVMNLDLVDETKERNENLEAFMKSLGTNYDTALNFEDNLLQLLKGQGIKLEVASMAKDILRRYHEDAK